ncbi:unnamed protein product [Ambrosiozyma monospora]|uniref:Unnamed protein product n=1 Tax=Ambrosiozyma monospora TaxID=43982 RepID=A0ACB5SY96_AMBMO|nr:unnamed protein product [Ambrosiozyma monospora]
MKKFSIKKPENGVKKPEGKKKIGFSLKKKSAVTNQLQKSKISIFGEKEDDSILGKRIEITNTEEVKEKKIEELVIKPVVRKGTWEYKKRQALGKVVSRDQKKGNGDEDDQARQSLLAGEDTELIETTAIEQPVIKHDEEEVEETTEESYKRVPVEAFGLAMLKGMGFKGNKTNNRNKAEYGLSSSSSKPRPTALGLGAKPMPVPETSPSYVPVVAVKKRKANSSE